MVRGRLKSACPARWFTDFQLRVRLATQREHPISRILEVATHCCRPGNPQDVSCVLIDKGLIRSQSASTLRQMQTANSTLSGEFIGSLEPLPQSHRVDFLVSLFEARREILLALDSGILPSNRYALDTEDFEFLLAVDALSRETAGGVTIMRLQQELGISVATVHRRVRFLCSDSKWLEDPKRVACIQFSEQGLSQWNQLIFDLSSICESWAFGGDLNRKDNQLLIHQNVLFDLRKVLQSKHISRSGRPVNLSNKADLTEFQNGAVELSALDVVVAVLRIGRQLSQPCEDLAIRHQLSLNEADILVILALYLSESVTSCSDVKKSHIVKDKIGWDSFNQISRYLVHSHRVNTSVFSRCIKHLGEGDGNLGLVQVRSWGGRSKAARVSEQGYRCAERLWRDYLSMADDLLKVVPEDLIRVGVLINKQIACSAGQSLVNSNTCTDVEKKDSLAHSKDLIDRNYYNIDSGDVLKRSMEMRKNEVHIIESIQQKDSWRSDSTEMWNTVSKPPAEGGISNPSNPKDSFRRSSRASDDEKLKPFRGHSYMYKKLKQENDELRQTIDGLITIINRFRSENKSLEQNFYDFEKKRLSDGLGQESSEISA
jgi:hypothetical protein